MAYVGNLAFDANQKQIKEVLEGCNVTIIRLHTDKNTGKSMGYAHVHFADEESLDRYNLMACRQPPGFCAVHHSYGCQPVF